MVAVINLFSLFFADDLYAIATAILLICGGTSIGVNSYFCYVFWLFVKSDTQEEKVTKIISFEEVKQANRRNSETRGRTASGQNRMRNYMYPHNMLDLRVHEESKRLPNTANINQFNKVFFEKPSELTDIMNLARSLFDLREYRKCANILKPYSN